MRTLLSRIEFLARRRILAHQGVSVSPTAKVNFGNIRLSPGSSLSIGAGSIVEGHLVTERAGARIAIGENTFIGNSVVSCAVSIEVGDDVLISWGCNIVDHNSHPLAWKYRKNDVRDCHLGRKDWSQVEMRPVKIGNKAWLGFNVSILKGIEVGAGAIIGAGSMITRDVPPWTVTVGNPARVIRELTIEEQ